jgi:hypothetical protein
MIISLMLAALAATVLRSIIRPLRPSLTEVAGD